MSIGKQRESPSVLLSLLGTLVRIEVSGRGASSVTKEIARTWSRCGTDAADATEPSVVPVLLDEDVAAVAAARAGGAVAATTAIDLLDSLSTRLTVEAIESRFGELWMLHACAVADPETGASVVMVAPSGTGKTTAARALSGRFGYLTDETAAIAADGTIVPYPKPLSVLVDGRRPKQQLSPDELGLCSPQGRPWLATVALLDRVPDTTSPDVSEVPTVEALVALAEQTSALKRHPRPLHMVADHLDRTGGLRRVTYTGASDLVPVVADLMAVAR
jgi:NAD(P)-dependent dehydrogenase (short-subunit alcohol dehydrogenase family)